MTSAGTPLRRSARPGWYGSGCPTRVRAGPSVLASWTAPSASASHSRGLASDEDWAGARRLMRTLAPGILSLARMSMSFRLSAQQEERTRDVLHDKHVGSARFTDRPRYSQVRQIGEVVAQGMQGGQFEREVRLLADGGAKLWHPGELVMPSPITWRPPSPAAWRAGASEPLERSDRIESIRYGASARVMTTPSERGGREAAAFASACLRCVTSARLSVPWRTAWSISAGPRCIASWGAPRSTEISGPGSSCHGADSMLVCDHPIHG